MSGAWSIIKMIGELRLVVPLVSCALSAISTHNLKARSLGAKSTNLFLTAYHTVKVQAVHLLTGARMVDNWIRPHSGKINEYHWFCCCLLCSGDLGSWSTNNSRNIGSAKRNQSAFPRSKIWLGAKRRQLTKTKTGKQLAQSRWVYLTYKVPVESYLRWAFYLGWMAVT